MSKNKHKRPVALILNPAPEGNRFMSLLKADSMVAKNEAEWIPGTNRIYIYREGEAEKLRLEMAARARRDGDRYVERCVQESRFSKVSWSGSKRRNIPAWERLSLQPIAPGSACS